mmetsp:Transcript_15721/g.23137  ORF Transcript_15721/g.23137 Transcript_15721/m.23137 type:complete len:112 (+) Transcript_15721:1222-1557(+)
MKVEEEISFSIIGVANIEDSTSAVAFLVVKAVFGTRGKKFVWAGNSVGIGCNAKSAFSYRILFVMFFTVTSAATNKAPNITNKYTKDNFRRLARRSTRVIATIALTDQFFS